MKSLCFKCLCLCSIYFYSKSPFRFSWYDISYVCIDYEFMQYIVPPCPYVIGVHSGFYVVTLIIPRFSGEEMVLIPNSPQFMESWIVNPASFWCTDHFSWAYFHEPLPTLKQMAISES